MILLAYHKWLLRESNKDKEVLAALIYKDILDQNPMAFELLEITGDVAYDQQTFNKAANLLLEESL